MAVIVKFFKSEANTGVDHQFFIWFTHSGLPSQNFIGTPRTQEGQIFCLSLQRQLQLGTAHKLKSMQKNSDQCYVFIQEGATCYDYK